MVKNKKFKTYDDLPDILTIEDIKNYLRIGKVNTYKLVKSKGFPILNIGKKIKIPKVKFFQWLNNNLSIGGKKDG